MFETVNWNISRLTLHCIVHRLEFRVKSFEDIFEKHGLLDRVAHWSDDELLEALQFMPVAVVYPHIQEAVPQNRSLPQ